MTTYLIPKIYKPQKLFCNETHLLRSSHWVCFKSIHRRHAHFKLFRASVQRLEKRVTRSTWKTDGSKLAALHALGENCVIKYEALFLQLFPALFPLRSRRLHYATAMQSDESMWQNARVLLRHINHRVVRSCDRCLPDIMFYALRTCKARSSTTTTGWFTGAWTRVIYLPCLSTLAKSNKRNLPSDRCVYLV